MYITNYLTPVSRVCGGRLCFVSTPLPTSVSFPCRTSLRPKKGISVFCKILYKRGMCSDDVNQFFDSFVIVFLWRRVFLWSCGSSPAVFLWSCGSSPAEVCSCLSPKECRLGVLAHCARPPFVPLVFLQSDTWRVVFCRCVWSPQWFLLTFFYRCKTKLAFSHRVTVKFCRYLSWDF